MDAPGHSRGSLELWEDWGHTCSWSPDICPGVWLGTRLCCQAWRVL